MKLLDNSTLNDEFEYPKEFLKILELGFCIKKPWEITEGEQLLIRYNGIRSRYPNRKLIPFAHRKDCDDVACWDAKDHLKVYLIHDYASPGFEQVAVFPSFWDWFKQMIEDVIEFAKDDIE